MVFLKKIINYFVQEPIRTRDKRKRKLVTKKKYAARKRRKDIQERKFKMKFVNSPKPSYKINQKGKKLNGPHKTKIFSNIPEERKPKDVFSDVLLSKSFSLKSDNEVKIPLKTTTKKKSPCKTKCKHWFKVPSKTFVCRSFKEISKPKSKLRFMVSNKMMEKRFKIRSNNGVKAWNKGNSKKWIKDTRKKIPII